MIEPKTKDIDGRRITVTPLTAMRSLKLLRKLAVSIGPGLLRALSGAPSDSSPKTVALAQIDLRSVADGVQLALDRLSENDLEETVKVLFDSAMLERDGKSQRFMSVIDLEFAGDMPALLKAVQFALEVNYGNFSSALTRVAQLAGAV